MTPACRNSASTAGSLPTAPLPSQDGAVARDRPLFTATTGLRRATRLANRPNLRGLPNDSR